MLRPAAQRVQLALAQTDDDAQRQGGDVGLVGALGGVAIGLGGAPFEAQGVALVGVMLVYAALLVFALIYIYPFVVQVSTAFKTNGDAVANPLAIVPDPITTAATASPKSGWGRPITALSVTPAISSRISSTSLG